MQPPGFLRVGRTNPHGIYKVRVLRMVHAVTIVRRAGFICWSIVHNLTILQSSSIHLVKVVTLLNLVDEGAL